MPKSDFNKVAEIALWHGCSPVNLPHIFRTPFPKNTSGWLLLSRVAAVNFTSSFSQVLGRKATLKIF